MPSNHGLFYPTKTDAVKELRRKDRLAGAGWNKPEKGGMSPKLSRAFHLQIIEDLRIGIRGFCGEIEKERNGVDLRSRRRCTKARTAAGIMQF